MLLYTPEKKYIEAKFSQSLMEHIFVLPIKLS